ncbi:DNA-binding protein [Mycolicibacterium gilvum]|uniref:DNA-binding protein n=1 Tax=Mycolicibacterium gilvum TaxID=1804 RepID=UPI0040464A37
MPFPVLTYSSADAADRMGAPSERWLIQKLRAGAFPGRKVGRNWRMTEQDITDALDACANDIRRITTNAESSSSGLTPTSRKRVVGA